MRIISGAMRGRRLRVPPRGVRPTSDRVRESVFARLECEGARVLDLYAGSGALGLEALSRGAVRAVFVERSASVRAILEENVSRIADAESARIVAGSAAGAVRRGLHAEQPFDLVFLDPPYASDELASVLPALSESSLLAEDAMVVVETAKRHALTLPAGLVVLDEREYGDTRVTRIHRSGSRRETTPQTDPTPDDGGVCPPARRSDP